MKTKLFSILIILVLLPLAIVPAVGAQTIPLKGTDVVKFVNPLPNLLTPGLYIDATGEGTYTITMNEGAHNFGLGAAFGPTSAWGYHSASAPLWDNLGLNYLGPTIVAWEEIPISVNWINDLPSTHLLDVDDTPHGAPESLEGGVGVQPHVHGVGSPSPARMEIPLPTMLSWEKKSLTTATPRIPRTSGITIMPWASRV